MIQMTPLRIIKTFLEAMSDLETKKDNSSEKFLGVTVDTQFTFEKQTNELRRKENQKFHALA